MLFDTAFEFGQEQIAPHAQAWERAGTIPRELLENAGALGFGALYVPEQMGGAGLSRLDATLVFERAGRMPVVFEVRPLGAAAPHH